MSALNSPGKWAGTVLKSPSTLVPAVYFSQHGVDVVGGRESCEKSGHREKGREKGRGDAFFCFISIMVKLIKN